MEILTAELLARHSEAAPGWSFSGPERSYGKSCQMGKDSYKIVLQILPRASLLKEAGDFCGWLAD